MFSDRPTNQELFLNRYARCETIVDIDAVWHDREAMQKTANEKVFKKNEPKITQSSEPNVFDNIPPKRPLPLAGPAERGRNSETTKT